MLPALTHLEIHMAVVVPVRMVRPPLCAIASRRGTKTPVHRTERASAVRKMCGSSRGGFVHARAVESKIFVLSAIVASMQTCQPLEVRRDGSNCAAGGTWLAAVGPSEVPTRYRLLSSPSTMQQWQ